MRQGLPEAAPILLGEALSSLLGAELGYACEASDAKAPLSSLQSLTIHGCQGLRRGMTDET